MTKKFHIKEAWLAGENGEKHKLNPLSLSEAFGENDGIDKSKVRGGYMQTKIYGEIEFSWGSSIEDAVNKLLEYKARGILVSGEFNNQRLYSDTVTMDSAYKSIIGKTKDEFDESQRKWKEDYHREEMSQAWMEKGREILTEDKWDYWDEIVPIRLGDLYRGMELGNSLDIIRILNDGGTLEEAKKEIESQSHPGMSYGLVCSMVSSLCNRGEEFVDYVR